MKKVFIAVAVLVFALNSNAQTACVKNQYPDLYTGAGPTVQYEPNGDTACIIQTIPFSKVVYAERGAMYYVTHPAIGNECSEAKAYAADPTVDIIWKLTRAVQEHPDALPKCSVILKLQYKNGKAAQWIIENPQYPIGLL